MIWAFVIAFCVLVGICMHLLAAKAGWQERTRDAENLVGMLYGAERTPKGVATARYALRMYCVKWGMVLTEDGIHEKEGK